MRPDLDRHAGRLAADRVGEQRRPQPSCVSRPGTLRIVDLVAQVKSADRVVACQRPRAALHQQRLRSQERRVAEHVARSPVRVEHPRWPPDASTHVQDDQRRDHPEPGIAARAGDRDESIDHLRRHVKRAREKVLRECKVAHHVEPHVGDVREVVAHFAEVEVAPHVHRAAAAASS
ncbi:MAG: hypothetical protein IPF98_10420 [Gemmatimonadetes bacterium]|nr:hypothetical protein [Gemmatimonadota bacterium]